MKHILFLFCDQFRYDCIGALGNPDIQTPALDSIAKDAFVFRSAVTPSPVCVPARLSMMAGQYPARTGSSQNNPKVAYTGEGFYSELSKAGYDSHCVGKMHYVWDSYGSLGFNGRDTQEEMTHPNDDYSNYIMNSPYRNVFDYNGMRSEMYYVPQVSQLPAEAHPTQWIGDRSVEYIENAPLDKPLFLFSSFIHPHPPFCPPAPWNKLYRSISMTPPFVPEETPELKPLLHYSFDCDHIGISEVDAIRLKNFYYACVSFVDYQIGRILDALKKRGIYDDTLIVFSADHGDCLGDYRNMGKRTMLSSAASIPFLLKVPGQKGGDCTKTASLVDLAPTLLSYAGISYDAKEYDGIDLLADITDEESREFVYSQYDCCENGGAYMCTSNHDKLVFDSKHQKYYYFDAFPETVNKYDEENPRVQEMKGLLDSYIANDTCGAYAPQKKKKKKETPKYVLGANRMDHTKRHDEEAARIPEGYRIDLEYDKTKVVW